ncbi:ATP-binding protein [Myxococcus sp. NMCA1]|nr:ATP-binding protein [Myxococcus sp. NMCA1]WAM25730.1 ATP-binding protein [Myxococcus sp. NMCA1]
MSVAAYPKGLESIKLDPNWGDCISVQLKERIKRPPSPEEIACAPKDIEDAAVRELLRLRHAAQAERLATTHWTSSNGQSFHLINDDEIRTVYGRLIGRIAHSHWWPIDRLRAEFARPIGAPTWAPRDWTVDPLKVACVLRCSDAAHVDDRRSPRFLAALRQIKGIAENHWAFQSRLLRPNIDSDRLVFTCSSPFPPNEADAWWTCLDTIRMIDDELRHTDALLADTGRPRLQAKAVAGADDPSRLRQLIPTEDWDPVETRVRITDVPSIVERLGGRELYGNAPAVPLRELLQNAIDAVRARRIIENRDKAWGSVSVRLGQDEHGNWIEVEDSGIGMSKAVLTGPLLDFGVSYWRSALVQEENPGLLARGFEPAGKFGIGFFSTFMWGERVRVTTRRAEDARNDTRVLEFRTGLSARPTLRNAAREDQLIDGGTRIRVWLKDDPHEPGGLLHSMDEQDESISLRQLTTSLCPASEVDLFIYQDDRREMAVEAHDWKELDGLALLSRMRARTHKRHSKAYSDTYSTSSLHVANITSGDKGQLLGRACLAPALNIPLKRRDYSESIQPAAAIVGPGGIRSGGVHGLIGILRGEPSSASRHQAIPILKGEALRAWVSRQVELNSSTWPKDDIASLVQLARGLGGDVGMLPIALHASGEKTLSDISNLATRHDELFLISEGGLSSAERRAESKIALNDNVLVVSMGHPGFLWPDRPWLSHRIFVNWPPADDFPSRGGEMSRDVLHNMWFHSRTVMGLAIEAIAQAWGAGLEEVYAAADFDDDKTSVIKVIGTTKGVPWEDDCTLISNPIKKHQSNDP